MLAVTCPLVCFRESVSSHVIKLPSEFDHGVIAGESGVKAKGRSVRAGPETAESGRGEPRVRPSFSRGAFETKSERGGVVALRPKLEPVKGRFKLGE